MPWFTRNSSGQLIVVTTGSGVSDNDTIRVTIATDDVISFSLTEALPAGNNLIGHVIVDSGAIGISSLPAGLATSTNQDTLNTGLVDGDFKIQLVSVAGSDDVTITRPSNTTQYAVNDAVGDTGGSAIFEFTGLGAANALFMITDASFKFAIASVPGDMTAGFAFEIYSSSPTAIADNAAYTLSNADSLKNEMTIDLPLPELKGASVLTRTNKINTMVKLSATGSLFMIPRTKSAYTPASASVYTAGIKGFAV